MNATIVMTVTTERVWTFKEMWMETCSRCGWFVPYTTMRDWIIRVCKLRFKDEYTQQEFVWMETWIEFQRNYPKRSTRKVKDFHQYMNQILKEQAQCHN